MNKSNGSNTISPKLLTTEILRLFQEKLSGTLFVTGENNQMAQIGFMDGNIVALSCLNKHGVKALPLIQQITAKWFQFMPGAVSPDKDLPPTADILQIVMTRLPVAGSMPTKPVDVSPHAGLSEHNRTLLQEVLAEFMGPVAAVVCKKVFKQTDRLDLVIDMLASEIPNPQQRNQFKDRMMNQFR